MGTFFDHMGVIWEWWWVSKYSLCFS